MSLDTRRALRKNFVLEGRREKDYFEITSTSLQHQPTKSIVKGVQSLTSLEVHAENQIQSELIAGCFYYRDSSVLTSFSCKSIWKLPLMLN